MKKKDNNTNKVFSYNNVELIRKNYSRKDFSSALNKYVEFNECIFEQTILNKSTFRQCVFIKCHFSKLELEEVLFSEVNFIECSFERTLFNKCKLDLTEFKNCNFVNSLVFPYSYKIDGIENKSISLMKDKENYIKIIDKARTNKYIRESNTLFKKIKNRWPKEVRDALKKLRKKDAERLGLSKREYLAENARRKKLRLEKQKQEYYDSQQGKNRIINKGILDFIILQYTQEEFEIGLNYAIAEINRPFTCFSILMRYIDLGIERSLD